MDGKIANLAKDYDMYILVLERALELAENIGKATEQQTIIKRKAFNICSLQRILIDEGKVKGYELSETMRALVEKEQLK